MKSDHELSFFVQKIGEKEDCCSTRDRVVPWLISYLGWTPAVDLTSTHGSDLSLQRLVPFLGVNSPEKKELLRKTKNSIHL